MWGRWPLLRSPAALGRPAAASWAAARFAAASAWPGSGSAAGPRCRPAVKDLAPPQQRPLTAGRPRGSGVIGAAILWQPHQPTAHRGTQKAPCHQRAGGFTRADTRAGSYALLQGLKWEKIATMAERTKTKMTGR